MHNPSYYYTSIQSKHPLYRQTQPPLDLQYHLPSLQRWSRYSWFCRISVVLDGFPLRFPDLFKSTRHTVFSLPTRKLSTPSPTLTKIGLPILSLLCGRRRFLSNSSPNFLRLCSRAPISFFLAASAACRWVYWSSSSWRILSTFSLKPSSSFFSRESPLLRNSPAATMTLMASQTLRLMLRESLDSLEKLSMRTRLMWEYFSLRFRSKRRASLPEMNLSPFTSSPSPYRSSSSPPRASPRSSATAVPSSTPSTGMRQCSSAIINLYNIQLSLAPMEPNFAEHAPHLDGSVIHLAAAATALTSFGSDDIAYALDLASNQAVSHTLINEGKEEITALVMDPNNPNSFILGTAAGYVKRLWPMHNYNLSKATVLYKCDRPIKALSLHPKGKLLGIATEDEQALVYSLIDQRLYSLYKSHEGGAVNVFFGGEYVCSQGLEGSLHLYELKMPLEAKRKEQEESDDDPLGLGESTIGEYQFSFLDRYKIATEGVTRRFPFFNAIYAEFKGQEGEKAILASGQTSLQVVGLKGTTTEYRIERAIREQEEILMVQVLSEQEHQHLPKGLAISSASFLSIWNYSKKEKVFTLPVSETLKGFITSMLRVTTPEGPSFAFILNHTQSSGKYYHFTNLSLLNATTTSKTNLAEPMAAQSKTEKFVSRWEESRLDKLIPDLTQFLLEKQYEESQGARFLYYNSIGCVIERTEGGSSSIELELHDKSRPKRLFLDARSRPFWMFAIREDILVYATSALLVFQCERQLKDGHDGWEFRWDNIQAISIGNSWVALCATEAVKILDLAGSELHTFCFDRRLVAFEAYEDMLAIVFHSAPPMWGCQALKMRIYKVTPETIRLERQVLLPMKANSLLKWFGFSEEGMLYCQDSLEVVRGYLFQRDEWIVVHSLEGSTDRLFIQHISGCDIYGFRLEQKQGKREEPKVLPRSLPRRIPMNLPSLPLGFLQRQQEVHLKRLRLRNLQLQHQQFRYQRWYKHKYSRSKNHLWYSTSRTILSAEEIKTAVTQLDMQLLDYLKKFLKRCEDRHNREYEKAAHALMLIVDREAHFQETRESARMLLEVGRLQRSPLLQDCGVGYSTTSHQCLSKLNQINILEKMLQVMNKS